MMRRRGLACQLLANPGLFAPEMRFLAAALAFIGLQSSDLQLSLLDFLAVLHILLVL